MRNAGHPAPLLYRAKTRRWSVLERTEAADRATSAPNFPIGIVDLADYEQFSLRLRTGDLVLCYTDSLVEAKTASGDELGTKGLLEVVSSLDVSDPNSLIPDLLAAVTTLAPGNLDNDDVTALLFRPNGLAASASFLQRAMAPIRVLGGVLGSLRRGAPPAPWPEFSAANLLGVYRRGVAEEVDG